MAEPGAQSEPTHGVEALAGDATSEPMTITATSNPTAELVDSSTLSEPTRNTGGRSGPNGRYHPTNKDEWLRSTYINADWPGLMTVEDFGKVTAASDPGDSWWQDSHIKWALEFIRRKHSRLDEVLIAQPYLCDMMYQAGVNFSYNLDKESVDYRDNFATIIEQLDSSNIVILPVNNGYQSAIGNANAAVKAGVAKNNQTGYQGAGGHWSFIVVDRRDREKPLAHYVDGMVSPQKKKNKKWKIKGIEMNGEAAGKVLRGFDKFLELEQDKFTARTLKFVPHMQDHNTSRTLDLGPCGPHLYAFLDHILTHKTSLIDPGLQSTYDDAKSRSMRASELNFNSLATRRQFAGELLAERKTQEAQHPDTAVANLTPEVLQSIMTVDGLSSLVRTIGGIQGPQSDTGNENNPALKKPSAPKKSRKKHGPKPGGQDAKVIETYVGRNRYHNVPTDDPRINPAQETDIKFPPGLVNMPDFTTLSHPTLKRWVKAYDKIHEKVPDFKKDGWDFKSRALLHVEINKTLFMQSDETYKEVWSKDPAVFDPDNKEYTDLVNEYQGKEDKRPMYGVMREMQMRYYMGDTAVDELLKFLEPYKAKEPSIGKKRKRDDGDEDDESSSGSDSNKGGPDDNGGKAKRVKSGQSGEAKQGSGKVSGEQGTGGHIGRSKSKQSKDDEDLDEDAIEHGVDLSGGLSGDDHHGGLPEIDPFGDLEDASRDLDPNILGSLPEGDSSSSSLSDISSEATSSEDSSSDDSSSDDSSSDDSSSDDSSSDDSSSEDGSPKDGSPEDGSPKDGSPKDGSPKDGSPKNGSPKDGSSEGGSSEDGSFKEGSSEDGSFGGLSSDESDESDDWDDGLNDDMSRALRAGKPRKRKNAEELGPTFKRPKLAERDFLRIPLDEVRGWVSKMPRLLRDTFESRLEEYEDIRRARIWLERMFGEGFEHMRVRLPDSETKTEDGHILSEDEIKVREYNLLSETDKRKLRLWHLCLPGFGRRGYTLAYHKYLHNTLLRDPIIDGRKVPIRPRLEELAKEMQSDHTDHKES